MPANTPEAKEGNDRADPRKTFMACIGDANDPQAWSSIPYHVLQEGKRQGWVQDGLRLDPAADPLTRRRRLLWNLRRVLVGRRPGGFQYSKAFLDGLWAPEHGRAAGGRVINTFQLYAPSIIADRSIERWYYMDSTLRQLIDYYGDAMGRRWSDQVLAREGEGYRSAAGVMTMSRFAADSVVRDYGVEPARVHVVVPGANITAAAFEEFERSAVAWRDPMTGRVLGRPTDAPARLVFVGRDGPRKGLDRLIRALAIARSRGGTMTLRVIGLAAADVEPDLRMVPGVEWMGLISRRTDAERLFRLIAECDIGCLLSRQEMAGISLLEFVAMGLAVIGPQTGGSPDLMTPETSVGVTPEATDEELAELLMSIDRDREAWDQKRRAAWASRRDVLWERSLNRMSEVMATRSAVL